MIKRPVLKKKKERLGKVIQANTCPFKTFIVHEFTSSLYGQAACQPRLSSMKPDLTPFFDTEGHFTPAWIDIPLILVHVCSCPVHDC